jgi:hypothetical protein
MNGKVIVIISSESWGEVFVSKHHYAKYLSQDNKVYFLNPPSIKWRINHLFSIPIVLNKVDKNLIILNYGNPIPYLAKFPFSVQKRVYSQIIKTINSRFFSDEKLDIVWSFDLKRFFNLQKWRAKRHIFHAVELIDHPFFLKDAPYRHLIVKSADVVLSIADLISEQIEPWNSNIIKINHGIDLKNTKLSNPLPAIPGKNKIKTGFVGNFQKSFDFNLLRILSQNHQDVDFIMIGPVSNSNLGSLDLKVKTNLESLREENNVFFIGQKNY